MIEELAQKIHMIDLEISSLQEKRRVLEIARRKEQSRISIEAHKITLSDVILSDVPGVWFGHFQKFVEWIEKTKAGSPERFIEWNGHVCFRGPAMEGRMIETGVCIDDLQGEARAKGV